MQAYIFFAFPVLYCMFSTYSSYSCFKRKYVCLFIWLVFVELDQVGWFMYFTVGFTDAFLQLYDTNGF